MAENTAVFNGSNDFSFSSGFGFTSVVAQPDFSLISGETYTVYWDTKRFVVQAYDAAIPDLGPFIAIGNGAALGYQGNGEPFAIACNETHAIFFAFEDDSAKHEIAIYRGEVYESNDNSIIVKDRYGNDVAYAGATGVKVRTADGGTKVFVDGNNIPEPVETIIDPVFSSGDMVVRPEAGKVFSKATVKMPLDLIPENIADGVNIAGIIGSLKGGGNAAVFFEQLSRSGSSSSTTITHGLGVAPDLVICFTTGFATSSMQLSCNYAIVGVSQALGSAKGMTYLQSRYYPTTSKGSLTNSYTTNPIEGTSIMEINNANTETVILPNIPKGTAHVLVIGGLT